MSTNKIISARIDELSGLYQVTVDRSNNDGSTTRHPLRIAVTRSSTHAAWMNELLGLVNSALPPDGTKLTPEMTNEISRREQLKAQNNAFDAMLAAKQKASDDLDAQIAAKQAQLTPAKVAPK